MSTTGHETEVVQVQGLKASLKKGGNKGLFNECICSTAGGTAAKVANTVPPSFSLVSEATIIVKFTYAISVANATFKVGDNDAKPIYYRGAALEANMIKAGDKVMLRYDGTAYNIIGSLGETYESKQAASGGTDLSLVTTGEKDTWNNMIPSSQKGASNGVASLDANGKVPSSQLQSYVDDVIEGYYKKADGKFYEESTYTTEITGESGKIYTDLSTDTTYRWSGTKFTQIKGDLAIGTTTGTAADGGIVNTHVNDGDIHVTLQDKSNWSGKQDALEFNSPYNATTNKAATMADVPDAQIQSDWNQTTSTAKDYIKNKPNLATVATSGSYNDLSNKPTIPTIEDFHEAVATLSATPTSSTLTYTRDGQTYEYKIGDEVRVADQEAEEGYKFYKLYDITGTAPNQEAVWGGLGSGGGSVTITGTIIVVLEEYINNSKTAGSGLVGAVITLTNTSDSETVGTHTIVSGETGYTFSDLIPMKNYSISVSALSGYTQPEAQTVSELGIGVSVTKTFMYEADEYTIAITSDQGASDPAISEAVVTINGTDYENGDTIKIATGTSQSDIEALCSATDVAGYAVDIIANTTNKTITAAYEELKGIDLGLPSGTLWAEANVGAENPEDGGLFFSWGNVIGYSSTDGYVFNDTNYQLTSGAALSGDIPQSVEYDAALANMGAPWMLPNQTQITELIDNTDSERVTVNGMVCIKCMKKTDHSVYILLPIPGYVYNSSTPADVGASSGYWTTTYNSSAYAKDLSIGYSSVSTNHNGTRAIGLPLRAVRFPNTVKLRLTTTDNSSNAGIIVEVSNGSSITWYLKTDSNGVITTSLPNGTYTLTSFSHSLNVSTIVVSGNATVNISATKMEYVDLGLSVKWATCNLGASSPIESGDYFSWGNIEGHAKDSVYDFNQTNYNSTPGASLTASIASNDSAHDAALAIKESPWRMPTKGEYDELISGCTATWVTIDGVNGTIFKSNVSGYTDKKIFIPASGSYNGTTLNTYNSIGYCWASTYYDASRSCYIYHRSSGKNSDKGPRVQGRNIRPVQ